MAELFLAKDPRVNRFVVIKRILPYLAEDPEFVTMFLDEARIVGQLHHANIVEVHELGQLDGAIFIAMEWVDGVDLRKVVVKEQARGSGVIPVGPAAWFTARLCEGLHYAHHRPGADGKPLGIIHRDISPQNVMVSFRGEVKLVDFGIAKASAWVTRSKPGVIKGKFLYLAPEQLTQDKVDSRADLFALGTMLYELTTGKSPFHRGSTEAVIYAVRMEDPPPPHTLVAGYSHSLSRVIMKCLEKDRARRFQTAEEIRAALEDVMRVDAPMTRGDASHYIAGLYGAADERTSIYVPPNAQGSGPKVRPAPAVVESEETTNSVTGQGEGRRPTRELALEPAATRPERAYQPLEDAPITDPSRSGGVASPPVRTETPWEEGEATAVLPKGERVVATELVSALRSDSGEAEDATVRGPGEEKPPARVPPPKAKPAEAPPWASQIGASVESLPEVPLLRRDAEPTRAAPAPAKLPPPVRAPMPKLRGKGKPMEPDDYVPTVAQPHPLDAPRLSSTALAQVDRLARLSHLSRTAMLGILGGVALVVFLLLVWALWPSPPTHALARVLVRAPKGTGLAVDGRAVAPEELLVRAPGTITISYKCPAKKGVRPVQGVITEVVPRDAADPLVLEVPCR